MLKTPAGVERPSLLRQKEYHATCKEKKRICYLSFANSELKLFAN